MKEKAKEIKGILVTFFRDATNGDYLDALNAAIKQIDEVKNLNNYDQPEKQAMPEVAELTKLRLAFDGILGYSNTGSNNHLWSWVKEHATEIANLSGQIEPQSMPEVDEEEIFEDYNEDVWQDNADCHPTWAMKYFDDDGNVIAEYDE